MTSRFFPPWIWAVLVLVTDFVSKRLVLANETMLRGRMEVLGDFLRFVYVRNPGSAMGLFPVGRVFLVTVSFAASIFLIYLYRTTDPTLRWRKAAMAAILGGAVGNLIDRVFYNGLVVDFIDVGLGMKRFYTFNIADVGVSIGGAILFLCILLEGRQKSELSEASVVSGEDSSAPSDPSEPEVSHD
ncbi:MAG: signal peptidase II [bacterium]|nr:signal peptidase II [bacterium]